MTDEIIVPLAETTSAKEIRQKTRLEILEEEMTEKCKGLRTKKAIKEAKRALVDAYKVELGCKNINRPVRPCPYDNIHPSVLCFNHLPEFKNKKHIATKN